jgi:hypothetical protein
VLGQLPECYLEDIAVLLNSYYIDSIEIDYFHEMINEIIAAFFTEEVDGDQHIQDVKDQLNIILKEIEYAKELDPSKQETIKNDTPINNIRINNTSIYYKNFKQQVELNYDEQLELNYDEQHVELNYDHLKKRKEEKRKEEKRKEEKRKEEKRKEEKRKEEKRKEEKQIGKKRKYGDFFQREKKQYPRAKKRKISNNIGKTNLKN